MLKLWRRAWQPTLVFLPRESHGQRLLAGYSPWGHKELDTTERLHFHFSFSCIGEGNGNPLQYSCLENPMDRGAWQATVHGVAKSWTWLSDLAHAHPCSHGRFWFVCLFLCFLFWDLESWMTQRSSFQEPFPRRTEGLELLFVRSPHFTQVIIQQL